jgi:aminocarboxymuconate-semialdehyde decarboxylase
MAGLVPAIHVLAKLNKGVDARHEAGHDAHNEANDMAQVWNKYANTAARKHGKPGREQRPKSVTIDAHTHVAVPRAAEFIKPHLDLSTIPLAHYSSAETKEVNAKQEADLRGPMTGYDQRFAAMDDMGVDMQLIMPPPPQCYHTVALEYAVPAAQMVNDGIAEFTARHKDRFIPTGTVPMQDGNEAAKELERCIKTLGFKGVEILTNVNGKELSDPAFAPFWKKADELGALVIIHPNGFTEAKRLSRFYFNNVIGNPFETTLALHYLIFDGVLERHPNLKIYAMHGGGYLGAYSGRIDHAWGARSDSQANLPKPPTSYLKNVYVDTVVFTPDQLEALVKTFGVDHVIMGTDYPFDMLENDPIGHIASVSTFDDNIRATLAGGNAKRLLGL